MGIFGAMTTAISGLQAQSFALENVSGNIANSRTTGFKRVDTAFSDLVPDLPPLRQLSGAVAATSRVTATVKGDIQTSPIGTNAALSGDGFFIVSQPTGDVAGRPVFGGATSYTRRGDFQLNRNGYLVNGVGNVLLATPLDPITSAINGPVQPLRVPSTNLPARATTTVEYQANLPKFPLTSAATTANRVPGSELLTGAAYTGATVSAADDAVFQNRTVPGGSVTIYDTVGTPSTVQIRWGKTSNAPDTWSAYYMSDSNAAGAAPRWTRMSDDIRFNASGRLVNPATGALTIVFTVNGVVNPAVNFNFTPVGLTQYADVNGTVSETRKTQDGYPTGVFDAGSLRVADDGKLTATYSNGQTVPLAQIPRARFAAPNLLKRADGGTFQQTLESGQPLVSDSGTGIVGAALEASNVDIADEFSKMIVTQQAYSANTRVVTTAQTMLQDVINIVR